MAAHTIERPLDVNQDSTQEEFGWIVRVFNNDYNSYEEVVMILMTATSCDHEEAYMEAWEIDHLGSSVVHHGKEDECRRAAAVIAQIGIKVDVSRE